MVFYRDGTEHNSYTPNGCLLAVHIVAEKPRWNDRTRDLSQKDRERPLIGRNPVAR